MNFDLSDDQRMLQDSIQRLIAEHAPFDRRVSIRHEPNGWSREIWNEFVALGLTMIPFPEAVGGLGLGSFELMLVAEAFGRGLVAEPYLSSIVLAGTAICEGAGDRAEYLLAPIVSGESIAALADDCNVTLTDGRLSGQARMVLGGDCAELFVVPVKSGAYLIKAESEGITRRNYLIHGGGGGADLVLNGVAIDSDAHLAEGCVALAIQAGIAFVAAEACGAMQGALDTTVEYMKTREQFGKPIGSNQALQHRAAEMLVEVEQARSAAIYAASLWSETDELERARGYAAVKAVIGKSARFVAQSAVQLHGGIGVSEEHVVSHWFRRLTAIGLLLGNAEHHLNQLANLGGFTTPEHHFAQA